LYFQVSLVPKDLIIEADDEDELKELFKKITIKDIVWSYPRLSKEKFKEEMKSRYVYLKI